MFHLLVKNQEWQANSDSISIDRFFEYTNARIENWLAPDGEFNFAEIIKIPALFVTEIGGRGTQTARVGYIQNIRRVHDQINIDYVLAQDIPGISNSVLDSISDQLDLGRIELYRTHWAVKDIDLFKVVLLNQLRPIPNIFHIEELHNIEQDLVSLMMPFAADFTSVSDELKSTIEAMNLRCLRADDIWENQIIIQDVISLICRSRIVICDCTGKNGNVFYEAGIAHTLGKDIILITQSRDDIPFDLQHHRNIRYLNNGEGRNLLASEASDRIRNILNT